VSPRVIAIISDTHLPRGGRTLPPGCIERLSAADLIIHAGDLTTRGVLEEIRGYGKTVAVAGNQDDAGLCARLPERLELTIEAIRLGVVHDAGAARGRLVRSQKAFAGADAVIFGHSHIPLLERDPVTGFQIFNPGSPTDKRRQTHPTMGWAQVSGSEIAFEIIRLD
jgi:putative phosphoesterase